MVGCWGGWGGGKRLISLGLKKPNSNSFILFCCFGCFGNYLSLVVLSVEEWVVDAVLDDLEGFILSLVYDGEMQVPGKIMWVAI